MEITWILTGLILIFGALLHYFSNLKHKYWEQRGIAYVKPEFGYGNVKGLDVLYHCSEIFKKWYLELKPQGKFGGVFFYYRPVAILTDLDLIKTILIKDFNLLPNRGAYYNQKDDPLSAHMINIEDDYWKNLRNKLTPTFTSGKIKMMFGTIGHEVTNLVTKIEKEISIQESVDMKDILGRFTTDVIASCAFGIESNSLNDPKSEFFEMGQKAFETKSIIHKLIRFNFPNFGRKIGFKLLNKEMTNFYMNLTRNTVEYREKHSIERNDFMNLLIKMKNSSGNDRLTLNEIAAQSLIFYVAGHETTAITLTYCFFELSKNLEIQERAREFTRSILENHDGNITYESIAEMTYLEQIINETLRMYPPASSTERQAKFDYKVPGTDKVIEKGCLTIIPIDAIHNDPEIYPDPSKFDPERFSPEEVAKRHPFSFLPFGEGPRICIGLRFAMTEAKFALAKLLLTFRFELDTEKTSEILRPSLKKNLLQPADGVYIKVKKVME